MDHGGEEEKPTAERTEETARNGRAHCKQEITSMRNGGCLRTFIVGYLRH